MTDPRPTDPPGTQFDDPADGLRSRPADVGHDRITPTHTRTSAAWTLAAAGAFLLLLMLVFIFQNSSDVTLEVLMFEGNVPLGAALLLAAVIGALTVVFLGAGRLLQMRLAARRHRRAA